MAAQIRGNTPLEMGWTVGAALILVVLTVVTFVYLDDIENPPASGPNGLRADQAQFASIDQPDPPTSGGPILRIEVNGQQYLWRYDYPGGDQLFSYYEMVVPTDTTVVLEITASDVIHSWWIPKLGGKVDGVPGHVTETWFKVPAGKEGIYRGQCAELCGSRPRRHARVRAVTPDEFEEWAEGRARTSRTAGEDLLRAARSSVRGRRRLAWKPEAQHGASAAARPRSTLHGLQAPQRGWLAWLTTTDHKKIGILYIATAFVFMFLGGVEALDDAPPARPAGQHARQTPRPTTAS